MRAAEKKFAEWDDRNFPSRVCLRRPLRHSTRNRIQLCLYLRRRHAALESRDGAQIVVASSYRFEFVWSPHLRARRRKVKLRRHNAEQNLLALAENLNFHFLANEIRIATELPLPQAVADDDDIFVIIGEGAAQQRLHTERPEEVDLDAHA